MKIMVCLILVVTLLCFCNSKNKVCLHKKFSSEVPASMSDSTYKTFKKKVHNLAGLSDISNGVNGIEIRFWLGYLYSETDDLLVLRDSNNVWYGEWCRLKYNYSGGRNSKLDSISVTRIPISPLCGWKNFIDTLYSFNVESGLDYSKLSSYNKDSDVTSNYIVEYSTCNKYKSYRLDAPCRNQKNIENQRACEIVNLFERQTKFKKLLNDW